MEEPAGLHRIYDGPEETFYDALTHGPLQLELRRINHEDYRLIRRFGYQDHRYDEPFVCPRDVDDYTTDLASIPWFFQWVVPPRGIHFPAIMLHDALVLNEGEEPTHLGPEIKDREEADRIMRDAMGALGVGFVRRWLAWTGAFVATAASAMKPRWWWWFVLLASFGTVFVLGVLATIDVFDWWNPLPWMGERDTATEMLFGFGGGIVIPLALSVLWWKRWRAGAIGGVALALLIHVTVLMFLAWVIYQGLEHLGRSRTRPADEVSARQDDLVSSMRVADQFGKGSATFVDLRVPRPLVQISVTGPGMLVNGLRLVTDLGILEGHSHPALVQLAERLQATAYCGQTGPTPAAIEVVVTRQGPALEIGVGPTSMYESLIEISTIDGRGLDDLLRDTIASGTGRGFVAGLVPIQAVGHLEHHQHGSHKASSPDPDPTGIVEPSGVEADGDVEIGDATHEELAGHHHGHP